MTSKFLANLLRVLFCGAAGVVGLVYWAAPIHIALLTLVGAVAFVLIFEVIAMKVPPVARFFEREFRSGQDRPPDTPAQKEFEAVFSAKKVTPERETEL